VILPWEKLISLAGCAVYSGYLPTYYQLAYEQQRYHQPVRGLRHWEALASKLKASAS
jgi:hypothetical protein